MTKIPLWKKSPPDRKITSVYVFPNNLVLVFDQMGAQMPEFQGKADEMIPKIKSMGFQGEIQEGSWGW